MTETHAIRNGIGAALLCMLIFVATFLSTSAVSKLATVKKPMVFHNGRHPQMHLSHTFKVLTYNVWNFNDGAEWELRKLDIVNTILGTQADFVGLNEVRRAIGKGKGDMFSDLAELLSPHGYSGVYQPGMEYPDQEVEEGVAFFTKLHVDRGDVVARHLHHDKDDVSDANRRVCLSVRLRLANVVLRMFVTHFSYSVLDQIDNAKGVVELMNGLNSSSNAILIGDFNILERQKASHQAIDILLKRPLVDTWLSFCKRYSGEGRGYKECQGYTFCNCKIGSSCKLNERIDRIYASPFVANTLRSFETVGEAAGASHSSCPSDHRAAFAVFDLPFESRDSNATSFYLGD